MSLALSAVAACGGGTAGQASPSGAGTSSSTAAQIRFGEQALLFHLAATGAERAQGDQLLAHEKSIINRVLHRCLTQAGFNEPLPPDSRSAGLFDNVRLPDIDRMAKTSQFIPGGQAAGSVAPGDTSTPGGSADSAATAAHRAARARCSSQTSPELSSLLRPWGALERQWITEIDKIQSSPAVISERSKYTRCVMAQGVPQAQAQDFDGFAGYMDSLLVRATSDSQRVAIDTQWTKVFVSCARSTVSVQEKLQRARKAAFIQERYQQIRDLQSRTDTVLAQLDQKFGFSGA